MTENRVKLIVGEHSLNKLYFELTSYTCSRVYVVTDTDKNSRLVKKILLGTYRKTDLDFVFVRFGCEDGAVKCAEDMARDIRAKGCNAILAAGFRGLIDAAKIASALLSEDAESAAELKAGVKRGTSYPLIVANVGVGYETSDKACACEACAERSIRMSLMPDVLFVDKRLCYIESEYRCLTRRNYILARVLAILERADFVSEPYITAIISLLSKIDSSKHVINVSLSDNAYYLSQISAIMCFIRALTDKRCEVLSRAITDSGLDLAEAYPRYALKLIESAGPSERYERVSRLLRAGGVLKEWQGVSEYLRACISECEQATGRRKTAAAVGRDSVIRAAARCGCPEEGERIIALLGL